MLQNARVLATDQIADESAVVPAVAKVTLEVDTVARGFVQSLPIQPFRETL